MAKLRIEYYKRRCIGQGNCAALDHEHFELLGKKAALLNSRNIGKETYALEVDCDGKAADRIIDAGRSCPVNAIRVTDMKKNEDIVGIDVEEDNVKEITAEYDDKEFVIDDKGYFLVRVEWEKENIEVAFCKEKNKVALKIIGKKPIDIYHTIINKEKLPIRKDQCAYIGRELQKAYIALKNNLKYVQDEELDLNKKASR